MNTRLDGVAKQVGEQTSRRKMMQTLAALGVGALGLVALEQGASADKRQDCKDRCINHCSPSKKKPQCRRDCRRRCRNRN
jgi:hypothetical protein